MGKKTLEEIGKVLLTSFISILTLLITFKRAIDARIDAKVDKTEYTQDKIEHSYLHEVEAKAMEKQGKQIDWIYQNEISKKTYVIKPLDAN